MFKEYKIRTLVDLYQVPADRLEDCLRTIGVAIQSHQEIARSMAHIEILPLDELTWIDDGKRDMTITFRDGHHSITETIRANSPQRKQCHGGLDTDSDEHF